MKNQVAIVLGGTFPHKTLINNLKSRGYYTILIDYTENPPAKVDADEHIRESTLDNERVLFIAKNRKANLVIATCIDQANVTACYVAEKLNLPAPYSYQTALLVSNKQLMKEKMVQNGIVTPKHVIVNDMNNFNTDKLNFPVIVKPSDCNSSKGVKKANTKKELKHYLKDALRLSRSNGAVIEEFIEGVEIGADCYVQNGEITIFTTRERRKLLLNNENQVQQIQSSYWPADLNETQLKKLEIIAKRIAEVFGFDNTPLLIQAILKNDKIYILEFAPRISGGDGYNIIRLHTGFDIIDAAINSYLGLKVNLEHKKSKNYFSDVFIYTTPCVFGNITGYEKLIAKKIIEHFNIFKFLGTKIGNDLSSNNRVAGFLVKSSSKQGLAKKIEKSIKAIEVFDINGCNVMRKEIYTF